MSPKKQLQHRGKKTKTMTVSEMARLGGLATREKLSPEQRAESASRAAKARWAKTKIAVREEADRA